MYIVQLTVITTNGKYFFSEPLAANDEDMEQIYDELMSEHGGMMLATENTLKLINKSDIKYTYLNIIEEN